MNLYKISQTVNNGWDTYSDAVVCAESEEAARYIRPDYDGPTPEDDWRGYYEWAAPEHVTATYIGTADPSIPAGSVIVASFHAG